MAAGRQAEASSHGKQRTMTPSAPTCHHVPGRFIRQRPGRDHPKAADLARSACTWQDATERKHENTTHPAAAGGAHVLVSAAAAAGGAGAGLLGAPHLGAAQLRALRNHRQHEPAPPQADSRWT